MKLTFGRIPKGFIGLIWVLLLAKGLVAQDLSMLSKTECDTWRGKAVAGNGDATCFSGKGMIQAVYADTIHNTMYVLLRDLKRGKVKWTGSVVAYDLSREKVLWSTPFNFGGSQFFLADSIPVVSDDYNSYGLNRETGVVSWKIPMHIGLVTLRGVGVAKWSDGWNLAVVGIDLRNGKELWRKPSNFDGIDGFEIHGDTTAIFLKKGLNYINLDTGLGFYIEARTLEKFQTYSGSSVGGAAVAGMLGGLIGGLIFGVVVIYVPTSATSASQTSSNNLTSMYMNPEGVFFTSKTGFYRVGYDGEIEWSMPVDKAVGVIRKIFVAGDAAFLISKGMLSTENGPVYSDSRLYRMNVDGAGPLENIQLNTGKREYIQDFLVKDSTIVVALNNKLMEIRLNDLSIKKQKVFGKVNLNSGFGDILNPPAIIYRDSVFEMASEKYPDDFYVANKGGMKIRFSDALEPVEVIREKNYFGIRKKLPKGRMLISNGTDDYLIDAEGRKVIDMSFSVNVKVYGGMFFDFENGKIIVVELADGN